MIKSIRRLFFAFYTVVLRLPIWAVIWLIGRTGVIKTVFVIYPHDPKEYADLCPNIRIFINFLSGRPVPGGFIMDGIKPIGIYFYISNTPQELVKKKNRHLAETIVRRMQWIQKLSGASAIGFAGQLGPILERRHGIAMEPPFFASTAGNIFSMDDAIAHLAKERKKGKKPWQLSIAILGGGELGEMLENHLVTQGYNVSNIDVKFKRRGGVEIRDMETARKQLKNIDFVVNLLHTGEDFIRCGAGDLLSSSAHVIDFSRPAIEPEKICCKRYMGNRIQRSGMRFVFALPGWQKRELPACSLPSIMAARFGIIEEDLTKFCTAARQTAFGTALASAPPSAQNEHESLLPRLELLKNDL